MAVIERKNIGPAGLADVKILTKSVRISFKDGETFDLPLEAVEEGRKSGTYLVSLTANKDKAYLHPPAGQYTFRFKQVGGRVNGIPMNKVKPASTGINRKTGKPFPIPAEVVYTIVVEVADGMYEGLTSTTNVPYSFKASPSGVGCDFYDSKRNLEITERYFKVMGGIDISTDNVSYFENPSTQLLYIERTFLEADKRFLGNLGEKGFLDIKSISPVLEEAPKKKVKKAK